MSSGSTSGEVAMNPEPERRHTLALAALAALLITQTATSATVSSPCCRGVGIGVGPSSEAAWAKHDSMPLNKHSPQFLEFLANGFHTRRLRTYVMTSEALRFGLRCFHLLLVDGQICSRLGARANCDVQRKVG